MTPARPDARLYRYMISRDGRPPQYRLRERALTPHKQPITKRARSYFLVRGRLGKSIEEMSCRLLRRIRQQRRTGRCGTQSCLPAILVHHSD
jgi:hypothetical protein